MFAQTATEASPPTVATSLVFAGTLLRRISVWLYLALALVTMAWSVTMGLDRVSMIGDQTIQLYVAQQMLRGVPPYVSAFYVKTPMTPMLSAAALMVGRALSVSDVVSVRAVFVVLGGMAVFAACLAGSAVVGSRVWRHGKDMAVVGGLIAGAVTAGTNLVPLLGATGLEPKLIVLSFGFLSIWLTARRSWGWAGFCGALAFLSWQPAGVFMVATLLAAISQTDEPRWRVASRVLIGVAVPIAAVLAYFAANGALGTAIGQAVYSQFSFGASAVTRRNPLYKMAYNAVYIVRRIFVAFFVQSWSVYVGILGWFIFAFQSLGPAVQVRAVPNRLRAAWASVRAPDRLPIVVAWLGLGFFSLFDFQGRADCLMLLIAAAPGLAWVAVLSLDTQKEFEGHGLWWKAGVAGCAVILLLSVVNARISFRTRSGPGLPGQQAAAEELYRMVGSDTDVQFFGCLAPLVLLDKTNATRMVHIGDKHLNVMRREIGDMGAVFELLDKQRVPVVVTTGEVPNNPLLHERLEATYESRPVSLEICPERTVSQIWVRRP